MSFLDHIFPRQCYSCGQLGRYFCPTCQSHLIVKSIIQLPSLEGHLSLFAYDGVIKDLIHDLKFSFVTDLVPELSLLISRTIKNFFPNLLAYWQAEQFVITPIPLHFYRQNWRGFNQSELLAQSIAPLLGLRFQNILVRSKKTLAQTQLVDKLSRGHNLHQAFTPVHNCYVPTKIILFDDVFTTGSTILSATSALPVESSVWSLTLAGSG